MTSGTDGSERILGRLGSVDGKGVVRMEDRLDTDVEDAWAALTEPERLARWLGKVDGDLRLRGEYRFHFAASGAEGIGRVEACEPPQHLRVRHGSESSDTQIIEATLTAHGDQTILVLEQRGMPLDLLPAYGAGIQVHVEDLAAHLAGDERCDAGTRWAELEPAYQGLTVDAR